MKGLRPIQIFRHDSADYFLNYKTDIANNNLMLLCKTGVITALFMCLYCFINLAIFDEPKLIQIFLRFMALFAGVTVVSFVLLKKKTASFWGVQVLCMLFILCCMGFVISISVFPFPDRPAVFFSILYLLMCVIFILPIWQIQFILSISEITFLILAYLYKTPQAFNYDWYSSVTVWIIGFLFSYLMLDLRLRENKVRAELEKISRTDYLTALYNRRAFDQYAEEIYCYCQKSKISYTVFMIDIDHFKNYNDSYGHVAGDQCLAGISEAILTAMGGNLSTTYRYGGEEFCCIMFGEDDKSALAYADAVMKQVAEQRIEMHTSQTGYVTVSIGVASIIPDETRSYLSVVQNADAALYEAKKRGRNCVAVRKL